MSFRLSMVERYFSLLPFILAIANKGYANAIDEDTYLKNGLNVHRGHITHAAVATELGYSLSTI